MSVPERIAGALADRYRIERELGQGGMALVYLAHDVRHDRRVALKVLRGELAAVIGASRFLAEIKTTANLQHPHILPLHDSGEVDGTVYYVMPFVEGESLRDRLLHEKQLPVEEAIRIAVEVAGALEYAHQHKVIHRDIKPENILLQGSHALVADFGIALAAARSEGGTRMTETGMSLGTPHYMSPEQAMGEREITAKSDVYALGCVLYEMLTGEPPFTGPTAQAIVARVMTEEPRSLVLQRRTVPRHVEAAVNRALAKLPADRFASAAQFAEALLNPTAIAASETTAVPVARRPVHRWVTPLIGSAALLALVGAYFAGRGMAPARRAELVRFVVNPPDSVTAFARCCGNELALSPDGTTLVFVGTKPSTSRTGPLYRRTLGQLQAEPIPGTDGASVPFFSPDSRWVGFFLEGRIRKVSLAGGPALPVVAAGNVAEASWGEGDQIVYSERGHLKVVSAAGGQPKTVTTPDSSTGHYAPSFLPGGRSVLFTMRPVGGSLDLTSIGVVDLESGRVDTIGPGTKAHYASGYLLFAGADNTLLAQPFDPKSRKVTGSSVAILDRIVVHGNTTHEFAPSAAGLAYEPLPGDGNIETLRLIGPSGRSTIAMPRNASGGFEDPAFSPDGTRLTLRLQTAGASTQDIWIFDRRQGTLERFTVSGGVAPSWSRDGRMIAFGRTAAGLYVKPSDGTGEERLVLPGSGLTPGSWLPGNAAFVFQAGGRPNTLIDIGILTLGDTVPRWLATTEFRERQPQVSPDGRWLAYSSDRTGRYELYVQPLAGNGPRVQVSTEGGGSPRWSRDGRTLYYVAAGSTGISILAATVATVPSFQVTNRRVVADGLPMDLNGANVNWDIHPNGKEFLFIDETGGDAARHLVWILNWTELVRTMAAGR